MPLTETKLLDSIREVSGLNGDTDVETPLFSSGALDSVAMLNLIMLLEEETGREIRADEVTLDNFDSASHILRFLGEAAA